MGLEQQIDQWFGSTPSKERQSAVRNAIGVMVADGKIDPRERQFLKAVCGRVGITESELAELVKDPGKIEFVAPDDDQERMMQLCDMIFMMLADGQIDKREMAFCIAAAQRLGLPAAVVPKLTAKIVSDIQQGGSQQRVTSGVSDFLKG